MNKRYMIAALFAAVLFCFPGWGAKQEAQKKEFVYQTDKGWHKTGITVQEGQKIKIKARGSWSPDGGKMKLTANGILEDRWMQYSIAPKIAHGRLIAYIAGKPEEYYSIGTSDTFKAKSGGELVIGVNDKDLTNNQGELKIAITY